MDSRSKRYQYSWPLFVLGLALTALPRASAQVPSAPAPEPVSAPQPAPPLPSLPAASSPRPADFPPVAASTDPSRQALEERVRQLEAMVQQLSGLMQQQQANGGGAATPDVGNVATATTPSQSGGPAAPGQSLPPNPPPSKRFDSPATLESKKANVKFGPGFEMRTDDEEFILQFHNLTQVDYRGFEQGGQTPVHDSFGVPRQWFMFSGRLTKPFGYFVSLANGFDTVTMLDVFGDISYDPRFQLRIGRMKTPFTYEFMVEPIQGLINPERSVFFNNFGENREIGVMGFGRILDKSVDWAFGVYNGARNSFLATQDSRAISGLLNWKPFGSNEGGVLENFNVGGSFYSTNANHGPNPPIFRTSVPTGGPATAGSAAFGIPFLAFNSNVRQIGTETLWDLHAAWFYQQLAVIGEWGSGFQTYSLTSTPQQRTALPVQSFYLQAGYLLTGETRSSVGIVKPLHPFDPKTGGMGAWELVTRYQYMDLGSQVFTAGFADQNNWANRVSITDLGFNWHMTQYLKVMFEWEHAMFNQPVVYAPGRRQLNSDMFLLRFQMFF